MKCNEFIGLLFLANKKTANIVEFFEICEQSDSLLQNLIDSIVELYLSTLYKLKFLA